LIGGRFRLHRMLGAGAMGQVWLATDERLQRSVAVKIVLPDSTDEQLGLRLEREARAAAAIQHTNVVRVFDYLDDGGRTLIVMEHVDGETLSDRLQRDGALSLEDALDYAAQICDGLNAAHRTGLVHRDLKPSNVMVTEDGMAKVLDFGIAKRTGRGEQNLTMAGAVIGTPRYMAPEQLRGEELDARVDIHAAGLLLFEMLAGRPAFANENFAELMFQVVSSDADVTVLEARGVPPQVIAILRTALAKNRDERWQDAKAMADALRVCLFGDVLQGRTGPATAGLRGILDSGERLLQRNTGDNLPAVTAQPVTAPTPATVPPVRADAPAAPAAPAAVPRTELIARTPASPAPAARWPMIAIPAVLLVLVGGGVFWKMRSGGGSPAPVATEPAPTVSQPTPVAPPAGTTAAPPAPATSTASASPTAAAPAPATDEAARAAEAKGTESVRRSLASAVDATWRFYLKEVTKEYGDEISDLRADFDVVVDAAGQFSVVRSRGLSEEEAFNEFASQALKDAAPIRIGAARRPGGWPMRVRFAGQSVRVSAR
jgi:eukaryotic-like serine/threonine-protein kinase